MKKPSHSIFERDEKIEKFQFRDVHPNIFIGTASDRYAGWIGQIYAEDRYAKRISKRSNRVGEKTFTEELLPVDSVEEYFQHFSVLEIDYTFYDFLLDSEGKPTQNHHVLRRYRKYLKETDRLVLKVPQLISAQKLRRKDKYIQNEQYLSAEAFTKRFYEPATEILGPTLGGLVFEQEYQRKQDRKPVKVMAEDLGAFFSTIPKDSRYYIQLRTESYLSNPVFEVLEKHGVGLVLSHRTWLPPLRKQLAKSGRKFFNSGRQSVVRLMTPIGTRYEDAYAKAHPFDKLVEGMLQPEMVKDTAELMHTGIEKGVQVNVIINNRAGGNAPLIAQEVARRFFEG